MGKGYLIDTNVAIGYLDNKIPPNGMRLLNAIIDNTPQISVITQIEILRYNTSDQNYKVLESFVSESTVIGPDERVIAQTINICKSRRIKLPDAIIAATTVVNDLCLITRNTNDFKNIPGIELLNPWN